MNFLSNLFSRLSSPQASSSYLSARLGVNNTEIHHDRLLQYSRHLRAYQGYSVRGLTGTYTATQYKRVKFNFVQPVVNLSAGWFASKPLSWDIDNDPGATAAAHAIWDRSGSDRTLLENAICCGIYGDLVGIATQDEQKRPRIEFVEPSICTPIFDGADYSRLVSLEIAFEAQDEFGRPVTRREFYGQAGLEVYVGDAVVSMKSVAYDHLPCVWIRNSSVKGLPFGMSDVDPILELVEEYDHIASKQTRIVDYYSSPSIVLKGIQKGDIQKDIRTVIYVPAEGDAKYLEWSGSGPDIENQLTRVRNAIAEISQVPAVAFGQADSGLTSISGVAIQILYGPLLSKTHRKQANWGPALEYLMWRCLEASGYSVDLEQVNVGFTSGTPVDGQALVAESSARIAARISSRRTEMANLGIECPNEELLQIILEEKALQLVTPVAAVQQDANTAAKAGARGAFAQEVPAGVGTNGGFAAVAPSPPTVADMTGNNAKNIAQLISDYYALMGLEEQALEDKAEEQQAEAK